MVTQQVVTLFVGSDPDSDEAMKVAQTMPFELKVIECKVGQCDFDPPMLISSWGVFDGLNSIIWFGQVAAEYSELGGPWAGVSPA